MQVNVKAQADADQESDQLLDLLDNVRVLHSPGQLSHSDNVCRHCRNGMMCLWKTYSRGHCRLLNL